MSKASAPDRSHLEWVAVPFDDEDGVPGYVNPGAPGLFAISRKDGSYGTEFAFHAQPPKPNFAYLRRRARTFKSLAGAKRAAREANRDFDFKRYMWDGLVAIGAMKISETSYQLLLNTKTHGLISISIDSDSLHSRFDDVTLIDDVPNASRNGKWNHLFDHPANHSHAESLLLAIGEL